MKKALLSKSLIGSLTLFVALYAFAANRKVSIPVNKDGLSLHNGSDVTVDYILTCFGTNGSQLFSSNSSLLTKRNFALGGQACTGIVNPSNYSGWANGMTACGSSVTRASADAQCGSGYHICTMPEFQANNNTYAIYGWISTNGFNSSWAYGYGSNTSGWSGVTQTFGSGQYPIATPTSEFCSTGPGTNGTVYSYCRGSYGPSDTQATFCCPDSPVGTIGSCNVEIKSSTPAGGYLQSPQFKGNTQF